MPNPHLPSGRLITILCIGPIALVIKHNSCKMDIEYPPAQKTVLIDTGKYNPYLPSGRLIIILCIGPIADPLHSVHFRLAIFN